MSYNFSALNDKDFEQFSRDILNHHFSLDLQDFKPGRDGGIDLRHSSPENKNEIVVQAKHYLKSGVKKLISDLRKKEVPKVIALAPERYILVTSVELDSNSKDTIVEIFKPYILSANDVFGYEDLNKHLSNAPEVEKRWFKLWLTSTNILQTVLNNAVNGRSAFATNRISRNIQLYCHCQSYDDAIKILSENKYILITGQPGVGKTTLANLITYQLLADNFQLVYIDTDVKDAEDVFNDDPNVKQVFYFDDFLGANYLELINPKTSESAFVNFLDRVKATEGKFLILTTRTTVLKSAMARYEKLDRYKLDDARKEIELGKYSELDRGRILYNHLYHSSISEHLEEIFSNKNYWDIIIHKNYNPRLIEFITDSKNSRKVANGHFMEFALGHLDNPSEVWRYAYEMQLTVEDRFLLHAIFSKKSGTELSVVKDIFNLFLQVETKDYHHRPASNPFQSSLKKMLDGVLKQEYVLSSDKTFLEFINPSINDFLMGYFFEHEEDREKLFDASFYIEQFEIYFQNFITNQRFRDREDHFRDAFARVLIYKLETMEVFKTQDLNVERKAYIRLRALALLVKIDLSDSQLINEIAGLANELLTTINLSNIDRFTNDYLISILNYGIQDSELEEAVLANWAPIVLRLFQVAYIEADLEKIAYLFEAFGQDLEAFKSIEGHNDLIRPRLLELLEDDTSDMVRDQLTNIFSEEDFEHAKKEVREMRVQYLERFLFDDSDYDENNHFDYEKLDEILAENAHRKQLNQNNRIKSMEHQSTDMNQTEKAVEELFNGSYSTEDAQKISLKRLPF